MSEKEISQNLEEQIIQNGITYTSSTSDDINIITEWISNLNNKEKRVNALVELSKKRDSFSDLAIYLWYSPGVISAL